MKVNINEAVFALFPDCEISGLALWGLDMASLPPFPITIFHKPNEEKGQNVSALWKDIYKEFPHDKKCRPSIDYLVKASLSEKLRHIHPVVDIYNEASLLSLSPFGGEDIDYFQRSLSFCVAKGTEPFHPLGKEEITYPKEGEVVWLDDKERVVCSCINYLESDIHKITAKTEHIIFVSERPTLSLPDPKAGISFILETLTPYVKNAELFLLNKDNPSIEICKPF